jgi:hypothetical protein
MLFRAIRACQSGMPLWLQAALSAAELIGCWRQPTCVINLMVCLFDVDDALGRVLSSTLVR